MDQDPLREDIHTPTLRKVRFISAMAFISILVVTDLFLNFFCSFWPLVFYLAVGGLGAWRGERLYRRFSGAGSLARFVRRIGIGLAIFSIVGLMALTVLPVQWHTKCSWRYCGRALSPGLFLSLIHI